MKDLPARRCVLALDSKTDIFRAKKILAGHPDPKFENVKAMVDSVKR